MSLPLLLWDDLNRAVALIIEIFGPPTGRETLTADACSVAIAGNYRLLPHAGAGEIICKNGVQEAVDVAVDISAVDEFLVVGGGRR